MGTHIELLNQALHGFLAMEIRRGDPSDLILQIDLWNSLLILKNQVKNCQLIAYML